MITCSWRSVAFVEMRFEVHERAAKELLFTSARYAGQFRIIKLPIADLSDHVERQVLVMALLFVQNLAADHSQPALNK